jgi:formylglycine-generating enzyme required for sulfatase activity
LVGRVTKCPRVSTTKTQPPLRANKAKASLDYFSDMQLVPGGFFLMGSRDGDEDELPVHRVSVSDFFMGRTPVTVGMWREYSSEMKLPMPAPPEWGWHDDHPMVNVSRDDIMGCDGTGGFCAWASGVTGVRVTLPTEQQYEYVTRNGANGQDFPWGHTYDDSQIWASVKTNRSQTAPIIRSRNVHVNRYGISDMTGNVYQWCLNEYAPYSRKSNMTDGIDYTKFSIRGGTYLDKEGDQLRTSNRFALLPYRWHSYLGFRVCVNIE